MDKKQKLKEYWKAVYERCEEEGFCIIPAPKNVPKEIAIKNTLIELVGYQEENVTVGQRRSIVVLETPDPNYWRIEFE